MHEQPKDRKNDHHDSVISPTTLRCNTAAQQLTGKRNKTVYGTVSKQLPFTKNTSISNFLLRNF